MRRRFFRDKLTIYIEIIRNKMRNIFLQLKRIVKKRRTRSVFSDGIPDSGNTVRED